MPFHFQILYQENVTDYLATILATPRLYAVKIFFYFPNSLSSSSTRTISYIQIIRRTLKEFLKFLNFQNTLLRRWFYSYSKKKDEQFMVTFSFYFFTIRYIFYLETRKR